MPVYTTAEAKFTEETCEPL